MQARKIGFVAAGSAAGIVMGITLAIGINGHTGAGSALAQDARAMADAAGGVPARVVPADAAAITLSFAPLARAAQPAVVNVFTAKVVRERNAMMADPFFRSFSSQPRVANSLGSGVIVDGKGLIVTNNHVVAGADQIIVALADRREYAARVVFADARLDLALLRVEPRGQALPALKLGDSDRAQVGDLVLAIGNPFGVGQTVTQGIVSALARTGIGVSDSQFFIQTDAAINPGNSGGALLGLNGELLGINSAILSRDGGSNGVGFAVPANMVRIFLRAAATGKLVTAWLGAEGEALTSETAAAAGLDRPAGVLMTGVSAGSPAAAAGLRAGDIVFAVDGKDVLDPGSLRYRIATQPVGEKVVLTLIRAKKPVNVAVTLAAPPETPARQITQLPNGSIFAGLTVANLSPAFAQELGAGLPEAGVVVVQVPGGAPAARTGFPAPGDLIEILNGAPIRTVGDLLGVLPRARTAMRFIVNRQGQRVECAFQAPASFGCRQLGGAI
jgi:Do/DeqQ family serine protease